MSIFYNNLCINITFFGESIHSMDVFLCIYMSQSRRLSSSYSFGLLLLAAKLFRAISFMKNHFLKQVVLLYSSTPRLRFAIMQDQFTITAKALIEGSNFLVWGRCKGLIHINKQLFRCHKFKELLDEVNESLDCSRSLYSPLLCFHYRGISHSLQKDVNFFLGVAGRFFCPG